MASPSRRRHRRERRRARVKKPIIRKYMTYCVEDGKLAKHWLCVTDKGRIFLRNHRELPLQAIKAEASLGQRCGCFWAIANILLDEASRSNTTYNYYQIRGHLAKNFSQHLAEFISDIDVKRRDRKHLRELHAFIEMKPFKEDIAYRVKLLNERFAYRTNNLATKLIDKITLSDEQLKVEQNRVSFYDNPFITPSARGQYGVECGWDY